MKALLLQPPSPARMNVKRDYAGGMGVADPSARTTYGHDPNYITLPYMSLLYSTAVLERHGLTTAFLDAQAENCDLEGVLERVAAAAPDMLVMVANLPSIHGDIGIARAAKARFPGMKIVGIGAVATPLYDVLADSGGFDAIVRGDPEMVLPALADAFAAGKGAGGPFEMRRGALTNAIPGRIANLDALPELPYHLLAMEKYWYHGFGKGKRFAALFASRGCAFRCYYCPYPAGFGGAIVHRDPVKVVDEIESLYRRYGVRDILFRDQVFTMEEAKVMRLCDEILRRGLEIEWVVETRLDRVNEPLLRKMKSAGCKRIHYGLESGDPELFRQVGKDGAIRDMETLLDNFRMTEELGMFPHMFVLVGLLGETWETIRHTIETIRRIKPLTLQVSIVTPYPGTRLFDEAKQKGLIVTEDWSQYTGFIPVMRTESLSTDDLLRAREMIIREHRSAVAWKRRRQKAKLLARYAADGSLPGRLARKGRAGLGDLAAKALPAAKGGICKAAWRCGMTGLYGRMVNRRLENPARILTLHRVIDDSRPLTESDRMELERGILSLAEFKRRVGYLKRHYRFLSMEEYLRGLREGRRAQKGAVILTFDDGFKDVYACAYPFLKAEGIPFTVFVATGLVGKDAMLSGEEIARMAADPLVSWGAHSVTHRPLTTLSPAEAAREIGDSKAALEAMVGRPVSVFCYPDGKMSDEIKRMTAEQGFEAACATVRGLNDGHPDLFALKRIPLVREPFERFAFRMAGRA